MPRRALLAIALFWLCAAAWAQAPMSRELPPGLQVPAAALPGPDFDVDKASEAWLGLLSPAQRALSDAYFEGTYWLLLWDLLYGVAVMALLLRTGWSQRMRDLAERCTRRQWLGTAMYGAMFIVAVAVLSAPLAIYEGFVREHAYALSNLTFPQWLRERLIELAFATALGAVALSIAYAVVRRTQGRWWLWATLLVFGLTLFEGVIYPVFVAPLLNAYKPLPEGPVREAVLRLARANDVPTAHLEWFDASKQTTRVSANVSGVGPIARINLNDNLLEKTSLPEIKAVLGHEMGHYVMHHGFQLAIYLSLLSGIALAFVNASMDRLLAAWGPRLGLRGRADPAALPLAVALYAVASFALTPLYNTTIRMAEIEADAFGLNAAREPQGFAMVSMRLSSYRKLRPSPWEEFIFFDHPSGYERVRRAMLWQSENVR